MISDAGFNLFALLVVYFAVFGSLAFAQDEGCVRITNCPMALKHVQNVRNDRHSINILREAHCGFIGLEPFVKCSAIADLPDSGSGNDCIRLQDCPAALKLVETRVFDPQVVNMFRSIHCGTERSHPLIHCRRVTI